MLVDFSHSSFFSTCLKQLLWLTGSPWLPVQAPLLDVSLSLPLFSTKSSKLAVSFSSHPPSIFSLFFCLSNESGFVLLVLCEMTQCSESVSCFDLLSPWTPASCVFLPRWCCHWGDWFGRRWGQHSERIVLIKQFTLWKTQHLLHTF